MPFPVLAVELITDAQKYKKAVHIGGPLPFRHIWISGG
jgi:hypothetical protein